MRKGLKLALIAVAIAVVTVACSNEPTVREGQNDPRPENPKAQDYVDYLVHSRDEYDRGVEHLTAWVVERSNEGKITRRWIPSIEVWDALVKAGHPGPVQFSEDWMNREMPIQTGNPATIPTQPRPTR